MQHRQECGLRQVFAISIYLKSVSHEFTNRHLQRMEDFEFYRTDLHSQPFACDTGNGLHMAKFAFVRCRFPLSSPANSRPEHVEERFLCLEISNTTQPNVMIPPPAQPHWNIHDHVHRIEACHRLWRDRWLGATAHATRTCS